MGRPESELTSLTNRVPLIFPRLLPTPPQFLSRPVPKGSSQALCALVCARAQAKAPRSHLFTLSELRHHAANRPMVRAGREFGGIVSACFEASWSQENTVPCPLLSTPEESPRFSCSVRSPTSGTHRSTSRCGFGPVHGYLCRKPKQNPLASPSRSTASPDFLYAPHSARRGGRSPEEMRGAIRQNPSPL